MPDFSLEFWIGFAFAIITLALGLGVTLAMDSKTKGEFRFSAACFLLCALITVYGIGRWEMSVAWPGRSRLIVGYALFALVAVLTTEGIRWAHNRHLRAPAGATYEGGGASVRPTDKLTRLEHLKILRIIDTGNVDLSEVGQLTGLESLFIWGPPMLNLSPLRTLTKLQELQISDIGMNLSAVTGVEALGDLKDLRRLTLGYMQIGDLTFVSTLGHLNEINIGMMPVSSVAPLRGLSSLQSVSLTRTNIVDISPLLDLPQLKKLSVLGSPARSDVLTELERRGVSVQR
jgi:Leucine-rich repeat (LRR) protein